MSLASARSRWLALRQARRRACSLLSGTRIGVQRSCSFRWQYRHTPSRPHPSGVLFAPSPLGVPLLGDVPIPLGRNRLLGEPSDVVNHAAMDKEMVTQLTESFLPGSLRADEIINDMAVSNPGNRQGARLKRWRSQRSSSTPRMTAGAHSRRQKRLLIASRSALSCDRVRWTFATREPTSSRRGNRTVLTRAHTGHAVCKSGDWCLSNLTAEKSCSRAEWLDGMAPAGGGDVSAATSCGHGRSTALTSPFSMTFPTRRPASAAGPSGATSSLSRLGDWSCFGRARRRGRRLHLPRLAGAGPCGWSCTSPRSARSGSAAGITSNPAAWPMSHSSAA